MDELLRIHKISTEALNKSDTITKLQQQIEELTLEVAILRSKLDKCYVNTCQAITSNNTRCKMIAPEGKNYCHIHDLERSSSRDTKDKTAKRICCGLTQQNERCKSCALTGRDYCRYHVDYDGAPLTVCKICHKVPPEPGSEWCFFHNGIKSLCSAYDINYFDTCKRIARPGSKYCSYHADMYIL
jgi:hypothetical protein